VILDNADDTRVLLGKPSISEQAEKPANFARLDCIPSCEHGHLLVTSRTAIAAKELVEWKEIIAVDSMNEDQALTLLYNKLGVWYIEQYALQLVRELDCMPLAISQAAAYIWQSAGRCTIQQYLEKLRQCDASEASVLDVDRRDLRRDRESSNAIILTWQVSFEHIREMNPSAADLLSLMSFFDRQAIPESLLHKRGSGNADLATFYASEDFERDLAVLHSYHFVASTTDVKTLVMHRLVQLATKKWLKGHGQVEHWGSQFISKLDESFPFRSHEFENWEECRSLLPHAVAALDTSVTSPEAALRQANLLLLSGRYASAIGAYSCAEKMLERSLRTRNDVLGRRDLATLTSMNNLARTYAYQGQWEKAKTMWLEVVEQRKEVLGTENQDTLTSVGNLADACFHCGQPEEAENLQLGVLEKTKRTLGEDHQDTLISMNCLARTYSFQGRCEEAEKLLTEVITKRKKTLGEQHPYTLISMNGLAWTFYNSGRYGEFEKLQSEAIEREKMVLGEGHPYTLISMDGLAWAYMKQGRWKLSEEVQLAVIAKREEVLIRGHPLTLKSMSNLAYMLRALGRRDPALNLMGSCVDLAPHVLGLDHHDAKSYLRVKTQWEREDSCLAVCNESNAPAVGRARTGQSVRNALTAMRIRWMSS
jgi:tetratricopeptide (TPR) repeat protein